MREKLKRMKIRDGIQPITSIGRKQYIVHLLGWPKMWIFFLLFGYVNGEKNTFF